MFKNKYISTGWVLAIALALAVSFIQLPYYITTPGSAMELAPLVEVDGGYEEAGNFMLTTVRSGKANIVYYALAHFNEYYKIYPVHALRPEGETDEEYTNRQLHMMESSTEAATIVAYTKANKQIDIQYKGVYVLNVVEGMPAAEIVSPGDRIIAINRTKIDTAEKLLTLLKGKKNGDEVELTLNRNDENLTVIVELAPLPTDDKRAGIGISPVTDREVVVRPTIKIQTEQIGGPSAGLMFSLEIYNQLTENDLTNGYQIAGTGTISYEGEVGPIGGIKQKIVAAHKAGVDLFFAPNENGEPNSNYLNALKAAKDIKTDMKIIPVDSFDDAINYLNTLAPKKKEA